jgi:hypothetical protein
MAFWRAMACGLRVAGQRVTLSCVISRIMTQIPASLQARVGLDKIMKVSVCGHSVFSFAVCFVDDEVLHSSIPCHCIVDLSFYRPMPAYSTFETLRTWRCAGGAASTTTTSNLCISLVASEVLEKRTDHEDEVEEEILGCVVENCGPSQLIQRERDG